MDQPLCWGSTTKREVSVAPTRGAAPRQRTGDAAQGGGPVDVAREHAPVELEERFRALWDRR